jgi:hypothetical protein
MANEGEDVSQSFSTTTKNNKCYLHIRLNPFVGNVAIVCVQKSTDKSKPK